jgi:hypothetical protein
MKVHADEIFFDQPLLDRTTAITHAIGWLESGFSRPALARDPQPKRGAAQLNIEKCTFACGVRDPLRLPRFAGRCNRPLPAI